MAFKPKHLNMVRKKVLAILIASLYSILIHVIIITNGEHQSLIYRHLLKRSPQSSDNAGEEKGNKFDLIAFIVNTNCIPDDPSQKSLIKLTLDDKSKQLPKCSDLLKNKTATETRDTGVYDNPLMSANPLTGLTNRLGPTINRPKGLIDDKVGDNDKVGELKDKTDLNDRTNDVNDKVSDIDVNNKLSDVKDKPTDVTDSVGDVNNTGDKVGDLNDKTGALTNKEKPEVADVNDKTGEVTDKVGDIKQNDALNIPNEQNSLTNRLKVDAVKDRNVVNAPTDKVDDINDIKANADSFPDDNSSAEDDKKLDNLKDSQTEKPKPEPILNNKLPKSKDLPKKKIIRKSTIKEDIEPIKEKGITEKSIIGENDNDMLLRNGGKDKNQPKDDNRSLLKNKAQPIVKDKTLPKGEKKTQPKGETKTQPKDKNRAQPKGETKASPKGDNKVLPEDDNDMLLRNGDRDRAQPKDEKRAQPKIKAQTKLEKTAQPKGVNKVVPQKLGDDDNDMLLRNGKKDQQKDKDGEKVQSNDGNRDQPKGENRGLPQVLSDDNDMLLRKGDKDSTQPKDETKTQPKAENSISPQVLGDDNDMLLRNGDKDRDNKSQPKGETNALPINEIKALPKVPAEDDNDMLLRKGDRDRAQPKDQTRAQPNEENNSQPKDEDKSQSKENLSALPINENKAVPKALGEDDNDMLLRKGDRDRAQPKDENRAKLNKGIKVQPIEETSSLPIKENKAVPKALGEDDNDMLLRKGDRDRAQPKDENREQLNVESNTQPKGEASTLPIKENNNVPQILGEDDNDMLLRKGNKDKLQPKLADRVPLNDENRVQPKGLNNGVSQGLGDNDDDMLLKKGDKNRDQPKDENKAQQNGMNNALPINDDKAIPKVLGEDDNDMLLRKANKDRVKPNIDNRVQLNNENRAVPQVLGEDDNDMLLRKADYDRIHPKDGRNTEPKTKADNVMYARNDDNRAQQKDRNRPQFKEDYDSDRFDTEVCFTVKQKPKTYRKPSETGPRSPRYGTDDRYYRNPQTFRPNERTGTEPKKRSHTKPKPEQQDNNTPNREPLKKTPPKSIVADDVDQTVITETKTRTIQKQLIEPEEATITPKPVRKSNKILESIDETTETKTENRLQKKPKPLPDDITSVTDDTNNNNNTPKKTPSKIVTVTEEEKSVIEVENKTPLRTKQDIVDVNVNKRTENLPKRSKFEPEDGTTTPVLDKKQPVKQKITETIDETTVIEKTESKSLNKPKDEPKTDSNTPEPKKSIKTLIKTVDETETENKGNPKIEPENGLNNFNRNKTPKNSKTTSVTEEEITETESVTDKNKSKKPLVAPEPISDEIKGKTIQRTDMTETLNTYSSPKPNDSYEEIIEERTVVIRKRRPKTAEPISKSVVTNDHVPQPSPKQLNIRYKTTTKVIEVDGDITTTESSIDVPLKTAIKPTKKLKTPVVSSYDVLEMVTTTTETISTTRKQIIRVNKKYTNTKPQTLESSKEDIDGERCVTEMAVKPNKVDSTNLKPVRNRPVVKNPETPTDNFDDYNVDPDLREAMHILDGDDCDANKRRGIRATDRSNGKTQNSFVSNDGNTIKYMESKRGKVTQYSMNGAK